MSILRITRKCGDFAYPFGIGKKNNLFSFVIVELPVTVHYIKVLIVVQKCFYDKFMSQATIQIISTSFLKYELLFQLICTPVA